MIQRKSREALNELSSQILGAAITVHREMGPGLLENVYHHCMLKELADRDLNVGRMVKLPLIYKGENLMKTFIIDILVEESIIVEIKAVEAFHPLHEAQLISYLKLADLNLGLLINFNVPRLREGIKRFVNGIF